MNARNPYFCPVTPDRPCPVCGKTSWCAISLDDRYCACRRRASPDAEHRLDRAGLDYWLYRLSDDPLHGQPPEVIPASHDRAEPDTLDAVYGLTLELLSLSDEHRGFLRGRGFTDQRINANGYRSLHRYGRYDVASALLGIFGPDLLATVPGFHPTAEGRWMLAGSVGLLFPVRDLEGRIVALKVRRDDTTTGPRYLYVSSTRFGGPGPGCPVHVPLHQGPVGTIRLTEGELKADVATALDRPLTLGLPGVTAWRAALLIIEALDPSTIRIAFDQDPLPLARQRVKAATAEARRTLVPLGYTVHCETWPAHLGAGIDDLLLSGGTPR